MSMDLEKKTFSTQPDYLIAGTAEIVTAAKEAAATLKRGAPVVLDGSGKLAAVTVSGGPGTYKRGDRPVWHSRGGCKERRAGRCVPERRVFCQCTGTACQWLCGGFGGSFPRTGHLFEVRRKLLWLTK